MLLRRKADVGRDLGCLCDGERLVADFNRLHGIFKAKPHNEDGDTDSHCHPHNRGCCMRCLVCTKAVNQYSKSNDEKCGCIENILHKVLLRGVDKKPYEYSDSSHKKERAAYKEYTVSVRARVWIIVFGHGRYKLNNYYVKLTPVNAKSFLAQSSISVCRDGLLLGYLLLGFL